MINIFLKMVDISLKCLLALQCFKEWMVFMNWNEIFEADHAQERKKMRVEAV